MYKAQLRVNLGVQYPEEHPKSNLFGHYFFVHPDSAEKIIKFTIECVKINGGKCWPDNQVLRIINEENLKSATDYEEKRANLLFDRYEDYKKVILTVFSEQKNVDFEVLEQIWNKINNEHND